MSERKKPNRDNRFEVMLSPDIREAIDVISEQTHLQKSSVARMLIVRGLRAHSGEDWPELLKRK